MIRMHMDGSSWTSMTRLNDSRSHEYPLNETQERHILVYSELTVHIYTFDAHTFSLAENVFYVDIYQPKTVSCDGFLIGRHDVGPAIAWIPRSVTLDVA